MIGVLSTCKCGNKFLRGIYPQKKCDICNGIKGNLNFWTLVAYKLKDELKESK